MYFTALLSTVVLTGVALSNAGSGATAGAAIYSVESMAVPPFSFGDRGVSIGAGNRIAWAGEDANAATLLVREPRGAPTTTSSSSTTTMLTEAACGDASGDGHVTSSDALLILRAAVRGPECDAQPCTCDVAGGGTISASDALAALKISVGQVVSAPCRCCSC